MPEIMTFGTKIAVAFSLYCLSNSNTDTQLTSKPSCPLLILEAANSPCPESHKKQKSLLLVTFHFQPFHLKAESPSLSPVM